jgi:hypothetical protein
MTSELFSIFATTCSNYVNPVASSAIVNTQFSGAMFLASDLWSGYVSTTKANNAFWIPKGTAFKIWESKIGGQIPATVSVESSSDSGATYMVVGSDANPTSGGQVSIKRSGRPLVIESHTGNKLVRFNCHTLDNDTTGNVFAEYNVEIVELNTE